MTHTYVSRIPLNLNFEEKGKDYAFRDSFKNTTLKVL